MSPCHHGLSGNLQFVPFPSYQYRPARCNWVAPHDPCTWSLLQYGHDLAEQSVKWDVCMGDDAQPEMDLIGMNRVKYNQRGSNTI